MDQNTTPHHNQQGKLVFPQDRTNPEEKNQTWRTPR